MGKEVIRTKRAPAAVGPYSQAIRSDGFVFTAGQIPLDPATGEMIGVTVGEQTDRVLQNLAALLEDSGSSLEQVVKTTVYLIDMDCFGEMNEIYGRFFSESAPARSCVQVGALPKGALVEIDAVALMV